MTFKINGLGPDYGDGKADRRQVFAVCRPTLIVGTITGGRRATETMRMMHLVYAIDAKQQRPSIVKPRSSSDDPMVEVRFDVNGSHVLNHGGTLYLADGHADDEYEISLNTLEVPRELHWHQLTAAIAAGGGTYKVPQFHSRIRSPNRNVNESSYLQGPTRGSLQASPTFIAANADIQFFNEGDLTIFTEWFG